MRYVSFILILILVGCGKNPFSAYPQVAQVHFAEGRELCSGTIVSQRAVLTAFHCVKGGGEFTIQTARGFFSTQQVEGMPQTNGGVNDLALLLFQEDIAPPQDVMPLGEAVNSGDRIEIVGFGCSAIRQRDEVPTLRAGQNVILDVSDYLEVTTPREVAIRESFRGVMGDANNAGACPGDSGGPAAKKVSGKLNLVGVTYAIQEGTEEVRSLFVDLAREDNREFLRVNDQRYGLGMVGF